jgi:2-C-methyl-D-erythritol 2,4-cyclodiphosphate synthase
MIKNLNKKDSQEFYKHYNFFRYHALYESIEEEIQFSISEFSLLDIKFLNSPYIKKFFHFDPLLYLILKSLLEGMANLDICFSMDLFLKLKLSFEEDKFDSFIIFKEIIEIIKTNLLCIKNLNIFILAQHPRLKTNQVDSKLLIKKNIIKIFENQFGENLNEFLENISVHAGTGENIGAVGTYRAIDLHVSANVVRQNNQGNKFIGYGFDRHRLIDQGSLYYQKEKEFNTLGFSKFLFKNSLQIKSHSDGDLIAHSICDAILSAIGESDIGDFFPDSDLKNKNRDSFEFVSFSIKLAEERGLKLSKLSLKLMVSPIIFEDLIIQSAYNNIYYELSLKLNIEKECIFFSIIPIEILNEKKGCVSRSEGLEAQAFVLLEEKQNISKL